MAGPIFEETSKWEFWFEILEEGGQPAAEAKIQELKRSEFVRAKQEAANIRALEKFNRLAPSRQELREKESLKVTSETRDLQKTGNNIQLGVLVLLAMTLVVTCSQ